MACGATDVEELNEWGDYTVDCSDDPLAPTEPEPESESEDDGPTVPDDIPCTADADCSGDLNKCGTIKYDGGAGDDKKNLYCRSRLWTKEARSCWNIQTKVRRWLKWQTSCWIDCLIHPTGCYMLGIVICYLRNNQETNTNDSKFIY